MGEKNSLHTCRTALASTRATACKCKDACQKSSTITDCFLKELPPCALEQHKVVVAQQLVISSHVALVFVQTSRERMRRRCVRSYKIRLSGFTPTNPTGFTTKGSKSKVALLLPRLNGEKLESNRVPAAEDAAARHSEASSGTRTIFYARRRRRRRVVMVEGVKRSRMAFIQFAYGAGLSGLTRDQEH